MNFTGFLKQKTLIYTRDLPMAYGMEILCGYPRIKGRSIAQYGYCSLA